MELRLRGITADITEERESVRNHISSMRRNVYIRGVKLNRTHSVAPRTLYIRGEMCHDRRHVLLLYQQNFSREILTTSVSSALIWPQVPLC
jgi:hypothetical protein